MKKRLKKKRTALLLAGFLIAGSMADASVYAMEQETDFSDIVETAAMYVEESTEEITEESVEESTEKTTEETTEKNTEESTEESTKESVEESTEESTKESVEESTEEIVSAPKQPVLNPASVSGNTAKVVWKAVKADGYRVYRKTKGGDWKRIKEVDSTTTSLTDTELTAGTIYYYTVRAFNKDGKTYLLSGYDKNGVVAVVNPKQPALKTAKSTSYNSVTVTWKSVSGADGYRVYRKTKGGEWKRIAETNSDTLTYKSTGLTCGTTYYYTIRAFVKHQDKYYLSTYDKNGVSAKPVPSAPALSVECELNYVNVKFKSVSGATSYRVYRKTSDGWKLLKEVSKDTLNYKDTTAKSGTKYVYTVKAMHDSVSGTYDKTGIQGALKVPKVALKKVSISSGGKGTVTWDKQSTADGYFIYRKESGGNWKRVGDVSKEKNSFTETGLSSGKTYTYTVAGYRILNDKKVKGTYDSTGTSPKLPYSGKYVTNVTRTYLGTSGAGRKMYSYQIGSGSNHIVLTMAIHSWEDHWSKDGAMLIKTGEKLIEYAAKNTSKLKAEDYSIIIVPMGNPDGLYDGNTNNGSGRCTTYRYNSNGKLVKGGVDLNRCFPAGFSAKYNARNYTGAKPLMAKEAVLIKKFIDSSKGNGKNYYIDAHGWLNQVITKYGSTNSIHYKAFQKYFPSTRTASFGRGCGFAAGYAQSIGYDAVLFEFPAIYSASQFEEKGCADKFIKSVFYIVTH